MKHHCTCCEKKAKQVVGLKVKINSWSSTRDNHTNKVIRGQALEYIHEAFPDATEKDE